MTTLQSSHNLALQAENFKAAGNLSAALINYRNAVALNPNNATLRHNYAAALGDAGQFSEAIEQTEAAFRLGLDAPETWLVHARALQGTLQIEAAIDAFDHVLQKRQDDVDAHRDRAQLIWMQTGDSESALNGIKRTMDRFPGNEQLMLTYAAIIGQVIGVEHEYRELAAYIRTSGGSPKLELLASRAAVESRQPAVALAHAEKAWKSFSNHHDTRHALCRALITNGNAERAREFAHALCESVPGHQGYLALLLTCLRLLEDDQYAVICDYKNLVKQLQLCCPEGWSSSAEYCRDLASVLDDLHPFCSHPFNLSVQGGSQISSIETRPEPVFRAFSSACQRTITRYKDEISGGGNFQKSVKNYRMRLHAAWSVKLFRSGFHKSHIHPQGFISSALHLNIVNTATPDSNKKAGWMKFGEPGLSTKPPMEADFYVQPRAGHIVFFPSYLWHGTIPFSSNNARITVAADFVALDAK